MTDLEMEKLCAGAMGAVLQRRDDHGRIFYAAIKDGKEWWTYWEPLHDDAQAMALVKKFKPRFGYVENRGPYWYCEIGDPVNSQGRDIDLNRAIVECVAKMQASTEPPQ